MRPAIAHRSLRGLRRLILRLRVRLCLSAGRPASARAVLEAHLTRDQDDFWAHSRLAVLAFEAAERDQAVFHLRACARLGPERLKTELPAGWLLLDQLDRRPPARLETVRSLTERARLESLPPITEDELAGVDVEDLLRRLADGPSPRSPGDRD